MPLKNQARVYQIWYMYLSWYRRLFKDLQYLFRTCGVRFLFQDLAYRWRLVCLFIPRSIIFVTCIRCIKCIRGVLQYLLFYLVVPALCCYGSCSFREQVVQFLLFVVMYCHLFNSAELVPAGESILADVSCVERMLRHRISSLLGTAFYEPAPGENRAQRRQNAALGPA